MSPKRDRVGLTRLRPSVLPHHRTCGFPHTAVESSERSLTACSRASMKEALMFAHCVASVTPSHLGLDSAASPATAMRIHSSPCAVPQEVVAAVATPLAFRPPSRLLPQAQIAPRSRDSSSLRSACLSPASSLLRTLLTSLTLSCSRSPRVRCMYFRPAPSSSTLCVLW